MKNSKEFSDLLDPVFQLVGGRTDSNFAWFIEKALEIIEQHPEILDRIETEQINHAKHKKLLRLKDKFWQQNQQGTLGGIDKPEVPEDVEEVELKTGRPRMAPIVVYVFLMTRGYLGGVSTREFQDFVRESTTLSVFLENIGESLPARSTISEQLNCVSNETRRRIHQAQLAVIYGEQLDDLERAIIDTTAVEADTKFPMDASVILRLLKRIWKRGNKFKKLDNRLKNYRRHWTEFWLDKMKEIVFKLKNANTNRKYKKWYRELYEVARKTREHLQKEIQKFDQRFEPKQFKPSLRKRISRMHNRNLEDLESVKRVIEYSSRRVLEGKTTPANQKVLSLTDKDAAFIKKGDREATIGYRPRLTRTGEGFVADLQVPEGNRADSDQLEEAVFSYYQNTGKFPEDVIADDGFANQAQREEILDFEEVERVCITGGKGKKMTPDEEWESEMYQQMRKNRSAVESLIFSLKFGFSFGQLARRGIEAVRAELLEDILAYNINHMIYLQRRADKVPRSA